MEIRQLEYFIEIVKEGSYTLAANKLYVSQSSLSKSVKKLKNEIGQDLFKPKQKKPILTYAGELLFEKAKRILNDYEDILNELQGQTGSYRGRVTVGIPPLICTCFFPMIIAGFRDLYPKIEINIVEEGAKKIQDAVDHELLDIGIVILPVYNGKFDVANLISDETVLVVSKFHPYAERSEITYSDLKNEKLLLFNEEYILHHQITANCRDAGFEPYIWAVSGQWEYLTELSALQQGVAILPRPIFKKNIRDDIRLIKINHPAAKWDVVLITKKDRKNWGVVKLFIDYCKNHIIP